MELVYALFVIYSIKYIDDIAYWFAIAMLAKHNKAARMTNEKSHDDETSSKQWEADKRRRKEISHSKQQFNVDLKWTYKHNIKPRATSWYAAKTFVPLLFMMLLMMIGLKLSRASHEHVTRSHEWYPR